MVNTPTPEGSDKARKTRGAGKKPVLRFVVIVLVLLIAFNAFFYGWFSDSDIFASYLVFNAEASAWVLRLLGEDASVSGVTIESSRFALDIKRGCDAIQPAVFFSFFVAASPVAVSIRRRLAAMLIGILALLAINFFRIVSLYYTGVFFPSAFEVMHVEVWQMVFVALPIVFWLIWLRRQWAKAPKEPARSRAPQ